MTPSPFNVGDVIYAGIYWKYALEHGETYLRVTDNKHARRLGVPQRIRIFKRGQSWIVVAA